jgi:hypothetical protein
MSLSCQGTFRRCVTPFSSLHSSKTMLGMAVMPRHRILALIALGYSTTCSVDKSEGKTSL